MDQPEENHTAKKWHWKNSYTLVLAANAIYIIFFYYIMRENC